MAEPAEASRPLVLNSLSTGHYADVNRRKYQRVVPMRIPFLKTITTHPFFGRSTHLPAVLAVQLTTTLQPSVKHGSPRHDDVSHRTTSNIDSRLVTYILVDAFVARFENYGNTSGRKQ